MDLWKFEPRREQRGRGYVVDKNFDGGRRGTGRIERLSEVQMPRGEGAKQLVHSDFTFLLVYSVSGHRVSNALHARVSISLALRMTVRLDAGRIRVVDGRGPDHPETRHALEDEDVDIEDPCHYPSVPITKDIATTDDTCDRLRRVVPDRD
ncbi:hypothetical protein C8Q76DRAFT_243044 [Earliella scabrosa]|nr:hypothetical protein C8Q76DRAFT_243044 [Earliella scabrosa]